jgi:UDP-N-acetylglucosamine--N-acetylmuramyl-(pentapeptide) pyrophosphoryl-undecaprenol N-acetylglucosamine transferase
VYPGLAVIEALSARGTGSCEPAARIVYVGSEGGVERELARRAGIRFYAVPSGGLHGMGPLRAALNASRLIQGWERAYRLGRRERPSVAFVTGGYASVPVAMAAWSLRVPVLLYLPDIEPGLAVRFIARFANRIAVTVEDSARHFPTEKVVVTGYPVRRGLVETDAETARDILGLETEGPVVLVLGGSRGCQSINRAMDSILEGLLEIAEIVHVTGTMDWQWVAGRRTRLSAGKRPLYHAYPYLHAEMGPALAAADLVVSRAGASTLGELPAFGLPAVLVPYPYAWRYQRVNADWLVQRGAAARLEDDRLGDDLLPTIRALLQNRPALSEMAERMASLARPDASARLAATLCALAGPRGEPAS